MKKHISYILGVGLALTTLLVAGCGSSSTDPVLTPAQAQVGGNFIQVEKLARPVINEGLVVDNALLNAFNSVSPAFTRRALDNPTGPEATAAAPIITDATATLNALLTQNNNNGPFNGVPGGVSANFFLGIFLPDVMRIDTTENAINPAAASFGGFFNTNFVLDSGRKVDDDVMDVVTRALTNNNAVIDNVPYIRPGGSNNPSIGHSLLPGQAAQGTNATFPYLAPAN